MRWTSHDQRSLPDGTSAWEKMLAIKMRLLFETHRMLNALNASNALSMKSG